MVCAVPGVVAPWKPRPHVRTTGEKAPTIGTLAGVVTAPGGGGETGFVAPPCGGRGGVDGDAADNATVDEPAGDAAWGDASPPAGDDTDVRAAGGGDSGDETCSESMAHSSDTSRERMVHTARTWVRPLPGGSWTC